MPVDREVRELLRRRPVQRLGERHRADQLAVQLDRERQIRHALVAA
jgi:hypothetical protein